MHEILRALRTWELPIILLSKLRGRYRQAHKEGPVRIYLRFPARQQHCSFPDSEYSAQDQGLRPRGADKQGGQKQMGTSWYPSGRSAGLAHLRVIGQPAEIQQV